MFVIWLLVTERLVPRGRLDEKERDRAELSALLDKALSVGDQVSSAAEERNRLQRLSEERRRSRLRTAAHEAEDAVRRGPRQ
jgi:hypothetical protein